AGAIPGEIRYIMQPGIVHLADGTTEQTWVIMDTLVVGEDGMLRSTSPPNQGIFNKSEINLFFVPSQVGFAAIGSPNVVGLLFAMDDFSTRSRTFQSPVKTVDEETKEEHVVQAPIVSMETVLGGQGDGPKFLVASSLLGDALIPLSSSFDYRIETRYADPTGLVTVATNENVRVAPGTVTSFALVDPPRYQVKSLPPILLTDIRFDFGEDPLTATPRIIISTVNLLL